MTTQTPCMGSGAIAALLGMAASVLPAWGEPPAPSRIMLRPITAEEWVQRGLSPDQARQRHASAVARLEPRMIKQVEPIGLIVAAVPPGQDAHAHLQCLRATGDYAYAEIDPVVAPVGNTPNDPLYPQQWHHVRIGSPSAWNRHVGSRSVIVAFVDTGIDLTHPDLAGALVPGFNSESMLAQSQGGDVSDINGHGTATAGVAAAIGNNALGVAGLGWNLSLMPVRATNRTGGGAYLTDILYGASWAASNGARVVNVSYEGVSYQAAQDLGWALRQMNSLLVWGAGNSGMRLTNDWPHVTIVSGTTRSDTLWSSSNFGPAVDLAAPAIDIVTTARGGGYSSRAGTSFSAPIVSGLAALIMSSDPFLTATQVEQRLIATATDLGPPGRDEWFGHGLVDAGRALAGSSTIQSVAPNLTYGGRRRGVSARLYETGPLTRLPDFSTLPLSSVLEVGTLDLPFSTGPLGPFGLREGYAASFYACLKIPAAGTYTFHLTSDDGSRLWLGGVPLIDNDGVHTPVERSASAILQAGWYSLRVEYFQASGSAMLRLEVSGPALARQPLPLDWASHSDPAGDLNADGAVDFVDLLTFLTWYNAHHPRADLNGDEVVDFQDFLAMLQHFS